MEDPQGINGVMNTLFRVVACIPPPKKRPLEDFIRSGLLAQATAHERAWLQGGAAIWRGWCVWVGLTELACGEEVPGLLVHNQHCQNRAWAGEMVEGNILQKNRSQLEVESIVCIINLIMNSFMYRNSFCLMAFITF